ncbi:MAG: hypothetical protein V4724_32025 [Pseudomonadota bacterium]
MTDRDHEQPDLDDDAAFAAFLRGDAPLAQALDALPQPQPPAALDAAINARIAAALAGEQGQQPGRAANDANDAGNAGNVDAAPISAPAHAPRRGWLSRWRLPLALAASAAGALLVLPFQQTQTPGLESAPQAIDLAIPVPPSIAPTPAAPTPATPAPITQSPAAAAAAAPTASVSKAAAPVTAVPVPPVPVPARPVPALPASVPPAIAAEPARKSYPEAGGMVQPQAPAAPPSPATVDSKPAPAPASARSDASEMPGKSIPRMPSSPAPIALPPPAPDAPAPAPSVEAQRSAPRPAADSEAKAWLDLIEEMLKAGLRHDAQAEWDKFRLAYPYYPVPDRLAANFAPVKK